MTDTPTAERDVTRATETQAYVVAEVVLNLRATAGRLLRGACATEYAACGDAIDLIEQQAAEITRLRAELEQVREALLYAKICMEAQQEISQPELGGFAYPDSPLGKVRAALSSSPGESAALSASPSPEDNP